MALIPIVNEQDEIIGYKERENIEPDDIYRTSGLMIYDGHGSVLLAQRAFSKSHDPGKWGPSVGGTVEKDETYESNIVKETFEELGLVNIQPTPWFVYKRLTVVPKHLGQWFLLKLNQDSTTFKPDPGEVNSIQWFTYESLKYRVDQNPNQFTPGIIDLVNNEPQYCKVLFGENYNS